MRIFTMIALLAAPLAAGPVAAGVPYAQEPDWISAEQSDYGTGCFLDDVNGDGFLDLAVSNGNDIVQAPNFVYLNDGGLLPRTATWTSANAAFSGHCEFADVDSDGYPELMVANYISPGWQTAQVQIYKNVGGTLESWPSWQTDNALHSFRATFGDADGDGDLDLAVATGESYNGILEPNCVYYNVGGVLQTTPGWISADADASYDVQFVDIDSDGDLDLAFLPSGSPAKIYFNENGVLETTPGWLAAAADNGNSFDFADVNGDGWQDMGVAFNTQEGGSGRFAIFLSSQGSLDATPDWLSATAGYGSAALFVDIEADGDVDFVTGRWWDVIRIYLNEGGQYPTVPDWTSSTAYQSVIENITFGDLDNGAADTVARTWPGDGQRRLFSLGDRYLQGIDRVEADGQELPRMAYCYHLESGWLSLAVAPLNEITVFYRHSRAKDMAVSNWDGASLIFNHDNLTAVAAADPSQPGPVSGHAFPNPFNARTTISYELPIATHVLLEVFDLQGHRLSTLLDADQPAGRRSVLWACDQLASGPYLYRLQTAGGCTSGRLLLVK